MTKVRKWEALMQMLCLLILTTGNVYAEENLWVRASKVSGINPTLLYSIALKESGMRVQGKRVPYGLTVNSNIEGPKRFSDEEEAKQYVRSLVKRTRNVDIGPCQINWGHNGRHMVEDPAILLDYETNVMAMALLLKRLKEQFGSEAKTVAAYHNANKPVGYPYAADVYKIYGNIIINHKLRDGK